MSTSPLDDALISAYSILSLLHYRGLIDSDLNREYVKKALNALRPFTKEAERRVMAEH
jgi:hypothetical protein